MENRVAAIWARVSSPGQKEISLDGQVERAKVRLESSGYMVAHTLKVVWTSTDLKPCPQFQELGQLIRKKQVQAVGMLDRDRIEATGLQRLNFIATCKEQGVEIVVCQGPSFMDGNVGQIVELALAMSKEISVGRASSGAKQGLSDRARLRNLPPTKTKAYGYIWENGRFMPNENHANARLTWELALSGKRLQEICRELSRRGIPTPSGQIHWEKSTLHTILRNPLYAGRYAALRYERVEPKRRTKHTFGKTSARLKPMEDWHFIDGIVEQPIITWDQFLVVQERLKLNQVNASRNARHSYLLRGLIECQLCTAQGICRHYYGVQRTQQKPAYVCSAGWSQTYGKKCRSKAMPCSEVEEEVKTMLRSFLERPEFYLSQATSEADLRERTIADIENSIKENHRECNKTIVDEQYKLERLTPEAFEQAQKLLIARRSYLREENQRLDVKLEELRQHSVSEEMIEQLKNNLTANLDRATDEDWRFILESLGAKILAFGDGSWDIEINVPVNERTAEELIASKTGWCTSLC